MANTEVVVRQLAGGRELARPDIAQARADHDDAAHSPDPWVRSAEWYARWHASLKSPGTKEQYARAYSALFSACLMIDRAPLKLERFDIDAWEHGLRLAGNPVARKQKPLGPASRARFLASVSSFYDYCINWPTRDGAPWLDRNPVPKGKGARPKAPDVSPHQYLADDQIRAITARADARSARDSAMVALLTQALRISEAVSTKVEDLGQSGGHNLVKVTRKGEKVQNIALPPPAWRRVQAAANGRMEGPIIATRNGTPLDRGDAWEIVQDIALEAGVSGKVSPHTFRHAAITSALKRGVPLQVVQVWAGHADPRTTERYNRLADELDQSPGYALAGSYFNPEEI